MSLKSSSAVVALAVASTIAGSASGQTFKISMGVRETGSTAAIGAPSTPNTGNIEWVNKDVQTLTADGTWQKFTFNFGTDPVSSFTGNGVLDGTRGAFEHMRVLNDQGVTDQITMLVDDVVNTVGGIDTTITDFESLTDGAIALFQNANFSGSTSTNVVAGGTSKVISTAAHTGSKSSELKYQFVDNNPTRWIRYATSANSANPVANPTIDISPGSSLSFWLNATVPVQIIGWNTDTDGNWSDATKWAGPTGIPNNSSKIARFLATTSARTVTVDQDFTINGININSVNAYTIAGPSKLTLNSPTQSGIDGTLVVQAGNHVISAPLATRVRVAASIPTGTSLKTPGILAEGATGEDFSDVLDIVKTGGGVFETGNLRFNLATISGGTVKITADGTDAGTSELNTLSFAGGSTPTTKLDLTNNSMIVDWDTAASPTPRANAIFSIRARIVNGYNGGDWLGNGITSSSAAANANYAIGYGDAATLAITFFGGRTVDNEATLVRYTRKGDKDLDRDVDFDDLLALAQNYDPAYDPNGVAGPRFWDQGDFNYDGIVNFDDLLALAQNYGAAPLNDTQLTALGGTFAADWTIALSVVPEPTSLSLLGATTLLLRRRR